MRVAMSAGLALLLAGCGGGTTSTTTSTTTNTSSASREPASDAKMSDPMTASGGSNDCSKNPDFAPVYPGAKISICSSTHFDNTGKDAGSFHYTTEAAPAVVLAFGKEVATKAGLTARISTETMFSAGEGNNRTMAMFVTPEGSGSKVTVNWGHVK